LPGETLNAKLIGKSTNPSTDYQTQAEQKSPCVSKLHLVVLTFELLRMTSITNPPSSTYNK